ncbi:ARID DNA-binding domain-containing protein [Tanacetum coccineum]
MKEVEAFNASKLSAKVKDHGERSARTLKEKRARCYICKIRGHVFWKCPNKKREAMIEQQKKLVKPTVKKIEERVKYPEKVHIITDYMVEGTDDASWDRIWMVGKEETERKFIFSYGVGEVTVDTRDRNLTIDPKEDLLFVKGLEDLKWDRNDVHDYVGEEYISWNGSLYAIKVNSFSRFLSFLNLIKKDSIVYKHWDVFSKRYLDMVKWFYLVYLNEDVLEQIPPIIGVVKIDLLGLHKMVDSLGGYLSVTLGNKWKKVAELHGLTEDDEEAIKKCYKKFIEMVQVYYETAEKPWHEKKPVENVVDSSIGYARVKDPQGCEKASAGMGEALEGTMNSEGKITHFGVKLEGNMDNNAGEGESESTTDSNDFVVIV